MNLCNEEFTIKCLYSKHWDHWKNKNFYIDHAVVAGGVAISFISITKVDGVPSDPNGNRTIGTIQYS